MSLERTVGTVVRGIRAPIIREGEDLSEIVVNSVLGACKAEGITFQDKDVVAVTEAVVARAQGNYASIEDIAEDIKEKFPGEEPVGVIFPILSRNRFAIALRGIAKGLKRMVLMFSYPSDEVGNHLMPVDMLDEKGINPYTDVLSEAEYREHFGVVSHPFTNVDYVSYYRQLAEEEGAEVKIIFANDCRAILKETKRVLTCDIHTRARSKRLLQGAGATVYGLDDIMQSNSGKFGYKGYNPEYGLLGSNKATEATVKLFPRDCKPFVESVQSKLIAATGKQIEVMVYGDGAFKDPVGKIWELADPVVSPAYTAGLEGTPNELKLKYLADNNFAHLSGDELKAAISKYIGEKSQDLMGQMESQGTTPRRLTDLIGSLSDLTSGSGDKGTPIVFIQNYFDNYSK